MSQRCKRGDYMPTSKKQMVKLNQVKKAKAEEALETGGCGQPRGQEEVEVNSRKISSEPSLISNYFSFSFMC